MDHHEIMREFRESQVPKVREPNRVKEIREEVKQDFVCSFCGASKRATVEYRDDLSSRNELVVEIVCSAFVRNDKTGDPEVCGNVSTRYYQI